MNKIIILIGLIFLGYFKLNAQVEELDYVLNYNTGTNEYEVSIVINAGSAETQLERTQFNSIISIVVPTGNSLTIQQSFAPFYGNQSGGNNSNPMDWNSAFSVVNPMALPGKDLYAIISDLSPAAYFDTIYTNDVIKLFSFTVGTLGSCISDVRLFVNGVDPGSGAPGMNGADFSNGYTIGGIDQLYNVNLPSNYNGTPATISPSNPSICVGDTIALNASSGSNYAWSNGSTDPSIGVFPSDTTFYTVTITNIGQCASVGYVVVNVSPRPVVSIPVSQLCLNQTTQLTPSTGGTWSSSNPSVASVSNSGLVTANIPGYVTFTFTNSTTGCTSLPTSPLTILNAPNINWADYQICVGQTSQLIPSTGGTWVSNNPANASVSSSGLITGLLAGAATFTFTETTSGCSAETSVLTIIALPVVTISDNEICPGESVTVTPIDDGYWETSNSQVASIDYDGNVYINGAGSVNFSFRYWFANCYSLPVSLIVHPAPEATITGSNYILIGGTTTLSPSTGGTWVSNNPSIATVDANTGVITGVSTGTSTFTFTGVGGCTSTTGPVTVIAPGSGSCIASAIVFSTQAQVDAFPINYPGCTIINGNVGITGSNITNLSPLIQITKINGSLSVLDANSLLSMQGLNNLTEIGGSLVFKNAHGLLNINGLNGLNTIGGNFNIENCSNVNNLNGLNNVTTIGESFNVNSCYSLIDIGFTNLASIGQEFIINWNSQLTNVNGLSSLETIGGSVYISVNPPIVLSLSGISSVNNMNGNISFQGNISNFGSFTNLTTLDGLQIYNNNVISDVDGFNSLISVSNSSNITINNCNILTNISGFNNLTNAGNIGLNGNPFLSSISGFDHAINLGSVIVSNNPFLSDCNVQAICERLWLNSSNVNIFGNGSNCSSPAEVIANCGTAPDGDGDGVNDFDDNCPSTPNPNQLDCDGNGIGDACETTDQDGDGILANIDNCPCQANADQADANGNGIGDKCDNSSDSDSDGIMDPFDNCPGSSNANQADCDWNGIGNVCDTNDADGDGILSNVDNCPCNPNADQADANGNGIGDKCDYISDSDSDSFMDPFDNCVLIPNDQTDYDGDGIGDACDDSDGDTVMDNIDNCRSIANSGQEDTDNDGVGNICDNCPTLANAYQQDSDGDGVGNACDICPNLSNPDQSPNDDDCDGIVNASDNCPSNFNPYQTDQNSNGVGDACENFPKVGIGTNYPNSELHISNSDVYIDNPEKGIILKDFNGSCYRVTISNGTLLPTLVPCPQN